MPGWHRTPYRYTMHTRLHSAEYPHTVRYTPHVHHMLQVPVPCQRTDDSSPGNYFFPSDSSRLFVNERQFQPGHQMCSGTVLGKCWIASRSRLDSPGQLARDTWNPGLTWFRLVSWGPGPGKWSQMASFRVDFLPVLPRAVRSDAWAESILTPGETRDPSPG